MEYLLPHEYQDLSYLEGTTIDVMQIPHFDHLPDGEVKVIKDYPNGLLVDMEYIKSIWWQNIPPRHIKFFIPKASLYC